MGMKQTNKQTGKLHLHFQVGIYTRMSVCVCPNAFGKRTPEC